MWAYRNPFTHQQNRHVGEAKTGLFTFCYISLLYSIRGFYSINYVEYILD